MNTFNFNIRELMNNICKLIIVSVLFLAACKSDPAIINEQNLNPADTGLSYLALGDSYTIGQNVAVDQRWPVLLAKDLKTKGIAVRSPEIIATTGWTSTHLLYSLTALPPSKKYDLVSLLIGVNNQFQGLGIKQYRQEFHELLLKSIDYANGKAEKVFVLSIPDWGVTPSASPANREKIAKEIDQFNAVAKEECDNLKILFIDITPISRQALDDPAMIANDQLHFSGKMYQLWVDKVSPLVNNIIDSE